MPEAPVPIEINSKKDALWYYSSLLGLPERRYPKKEEMPRFIFLPQEILGDFEESVLLSNGGIERTQNIFWNPALKKVFVSGIFEGNNLNTGFTEALHRQFRNYFGKKAILRYHTHPTENFGFSGRDLSLAISEPRGAYIQMVGSLKGVSVLFQTEGSQKWPVSDTVAQLLAELELGRINDIKSIVTYLYDNNLIYYFWKPPHGELKKGDLKNGIEVGKAKKA